MLKLEGQYSLSMSMHNYYEHYGSELHHQFTYSLPIVNAVDHNQVDARIWFFGTVRGDCMGVGGVNCVRRDQIEWFKDQSDGIPADDPRRANGIAFMHHAL